MREGRDLGDAAVRAELETAALAAVFRALFQGGDPDSSPALGVDLSELEANDLGHLYEGLLSLRLTVADGELVWQANEGGRKGAGAYYTRPQLVRHLVRRALRPAFASHLRRVRELAAGDPDAAVAELFDFHLVDPACGGGHFLLGAVEELAAQIAGLLVEAALPTLERELGSLRAAAGAEAGDAVEDVALLRRLALERCVHGVDLSPLAAEIARASLALAAHVPGLPPPRLESNVQVGDSLAGAAGAGAFPAAFARDNPGFDVILGNPPWEEVKVEELAFFAHHRPGLRSLPERERKAAIAELRRRRPDLAAELEAERRRAAALRERLRRRGERAGGGDPDLYRYFLKRYRALLREGGRLGVVLPRSAFVNRGSADFRAWLFDEATPERLDFLLNRRLWAFDSHGQYTVALLCAIRRPPGRSEQIEVAGVASSATELERQSRRRGNVLARAALGPGLAIPLLPSQAAADLLGKLRGGEPFPFGGGRWRCFSVRELDETKDAPLWQGAGPGWRLWKGGCFDQFDPHGAGARVCPASEAVLARARKPRPGNGSLLAPTVPLRARREAVERAVGAARVAYRLIANRTNSRTIVACLVPPRHLLANSAPYLAFVEAGPLAEAACLGLMNSLVFDWQARRFVEANVNFFILEGLKLPALDAAAMAGLATPAARLSCPDERFAGFAAAAGVEAGPLAGAERASLRAEIDARAARAWELSGEELEVVFADFTPKAVPEAYRDEVRSRFAELADRRGAGR